MTSNGIDLSTRYLGLDLAHPLMPGASPLVDDLDTVRRLEDAGASCIVMHSLFEEQIAREFEAIAGLEAHAHAFAEAMTFTPPPSGFVLGPDRYLAQIMKLKATVDVPVIASLNGTTPQKWLDHSRLIQEAGADALELNVYHVATDPMESGGAVERRVFDALRAVRQAVTIPVAVKLSPFYSALANLAVRLDGEGADGLVLFNRFYQPDIDPEALEVVPSLRLSNPSELLLRLRWLAVLSGRVGCSLAASGGVHQPLDAVRAIMAGAHAVQMVSALLLDGPARLTAMVDGLRLWMEEHAYASVSQMRGCMSLARCPDPAAFERANYMKVLQGWRTGVPCAR
jgi:dihydroorotate dehydrogenase (fumarate)